MYSLSLSVLVSNSCTLYPIGDRACGKQVVCTGSRPTIKLMSLTKGSTKHTEPRG